MSKFLDEDKTIRIRADIPVPEKITKIGSDRKTNVWNSRYHLMKQVLKMNVGDSFIYPGDPRHASGHIYYWHMKSSNTYISRWEGEKKRIWRIS